MKNIQHLLLILLLINSSVYAQEFVPLNTWRVHLSFQEAHDLSLYPEGVVVAAREGVFLYNKGDGELNPITTLDGIHSSVISSVGFDFDTGYLLIGHASGVLDLVKDGEVYSLTSLVDDPRDDKSINDFYFRNKKAYISTGIGVLVYNLEAGLFTGTYDGLGASGEEIEINEVTIFNDQIYAATSNGIISGPLQGANLNDFREWNRYPSLPNVNAPGIVELEGILYAAMDGEDLYKFENNSWTPTGLFSGQDFNSITPSGNTLYIALANGSIHEASGNTTNEIIVDGLNTPQKVIEDSDNTIYIADSENGLVKVSGGLVEIIRPSGPVIPSIHRLEVKDQKLYALPGALNSFNTVNGYAVFEEGQWKNFYTNHPEPQYDLPQVDNLFDVETYDGNKYFTSLTDGLLIIGSETKVLKAGDPEVSFEEFNGRTILTGLTVAAGNLWVANYAAQTPLHYYNGTTWSSVNINNSFIEDIITSPEGYIVIRFNPVSSGGVAILNPETGEIRYLSATQNLGGLPSDDVNDVVFDRDGRLWFATTKGIAYIPTLNGIFSGAVDAIKPVFENRFLLQNVNTTALAVDGGNRLWVGSNQGAWLFNNSLDEEVFYFSEENSPLLSNRIEDIILLQNTGEVFFATENGLISFRTDSSTPSLAREKVKVFPNPVPPEFTGVVGISGVTDNAIIKITDASGKLVFETNANGSTASWNLTDLNGTSVSSGIFLVFSSAKDGSDTLVGKIAVIR